MEASIAGPAMAWTDNHKRKMTGVNALSWGGHLLTYISSD